MLTEIINMTPEQFVYWLQGFMEIGNPITLDEIAVQQIKNHLKEVFDKRTPNLTFPNKPIVPPSRLCKDWGDIVC